MAAPATHIVLANKIFDSQFSNFSKKKFFIGAIFPDIGYLRVIERNKTHFNNVSLEGIKESDDFRAGLLFHSLVDIVREQFMREKDVYSIIPQSKFIIQTLKLFEDELFYERVENWNDIANFFETILQEELSFQIIEKDVKKWHDILRDYFLKAPSSNNRKKFFKALNFTAEDIEEIEGNIKQMRDNEKLKDIIEEFYINFENLVGIVNSQQKQMKMG